MRAVLKILLIATCLVSSMRTARSQVVYELEIDSIVALPDTIVDGTTVTFYMIVSMNSALFYQGNVFVELEYGGQFYQVDSAISANGFLGPNSPNTIVAHHRFSTEDDLSIGDNVVVVWPRIGDGVTPEQEVVNPYETTVTLVEPNGIPSQPERIVRSFIWPNPAITNVRFGLDEAAVILESVLYDITGRELFRARGSSQMDVSSLPSGIYFVDLHTEKGNVYSDKLLISR